MADKEVLKISSPWVLYYRELEVLFGEDPDIHIEYDEDENVITFYVEGTEKADALTQLLPTEKVFGNVTIGIKVVPANQEITNIELFRRAFEGNPVFSYALSIGGVAANSFNYMIFKNRIASYYADNLGNPHGLKFDLYENIARDVFGDTEVMFTTDTENNDGVFNMK